MKCPSEPSWPPNGKWRKGELNFSRTHKWFSQRLKTTNLDHTIELQKRSLSRGKVKVARFPSLSATVLYTGYLDLDEEDPEKLESDKFPGLGNIQTEGVIHL